MDSIRLTGRVKFYNHKAKFGFIKVDDTEMEVYVKQSGILEPINEGDEVSFVLEDHPKGPIAKQVKRASENAQG